MKTNSIVTSFILRSRVCHALSYSRCTQLSIKPQLTIGPISTKYNYFLRHYHRSYHLHSLFSDSSDANDSLEQPGMVEAFSHLETLTAEEMNADPINNFSSVIRYSRTDDTPASNFGKSTEEEVQYYLEMQEQLEGNETIPLDDGKIGEVKNCMSESYDIDANVSSSVEEFPWTSINPILRLRGPVASGYGRGGKQLGVPTANLPSSLFQSALDGIQNGVYFGWAVIEQGNRIDTTQENSVTKKGRNAPIKAVVNVGYSPTFEGKENKEKIVEAHLITMKSPMTVPESEAYDGGSVVTNDSDIDGDFYGEIMRLQLIGYLRPEKKFNSFPELISQIQLDIGNANWALDSMPFIFSKEDEFVKDSGSDWIGSEGGDCSASWEREEW